MNKYPLGEDDHEEGAECWCRPQKVRVGYADTRLYNLTQTFTKLTFHPSYTYIHRSTKRVLKSMKKKAIKETKIEKVKKPSKNLRTFDSVKNKRYIYKNSK